MRDQWLNSAYYIMFLGIQYILITIYIYIYMYYVCVIVCVCIHVSISDQKQKNGRHMFFASNAHVYLRPSCFQHWLHFAGITATSSACDGAATMSPTKVQYGAQDSGQ